MLSEQTQTLNHRTTVTSQASTLSVPGQLAEHLGQFSTSKAHTPHTTMNKLRAPSTYKRIFFIRHGQSEANVTKNDRVIDLDAKLTPLGRSQASAWHAQPNYLSEVFDATPPEICICSPLRRAMETASLVFKHTTIPIECSRYPRERWWKHYQCVGSKHQETLSFASTLDRNIANLDDLTEADKYWNPPLELDELISYRDGNDHAEEKYEPSKRENDAQGMTKLKEFLIAHPAQTIAVACHWGVINALTEESPNNCDMLVTDLDVNTGELLVLQQLQPPGDVETSV